MSFIFKALAASTLASAIVATPAAATITVNFSFTGAASYPGTVTGQLTFANAGTNVAATSAKVLTSSNAALTAPFDALFNATIFANQFTVTSQGVLTAASLLTYTAVSGGTKYLYLNSGGGYNNYELDPIVDDFVAIFNSNGFGGATYTPASVAAVPEPATWGMMILGFGTIGGTMRYRRRSAKVTFA